jgi:hypothetical protein
LSYLGKLLSLRHGCMVRHYAHDTRGTIPPHDCFVGHSLGACTAAGLSAGYNRPAVFFDPVRPWVWNWFLPRRDLTPIRTDQSVLVIRNVSKPVFPFPASVEVLGDHVERIITSQDHNRLVSAHATDAEAWIVNQIGGSP